MDRYDSDRVECVDMSLNYDDVEHCEKWRMANWDGSRVFDGRYPAEGTAWKIGIGDDIYINIYRNKI